MERDLVHIITELGFPIALTLFFFGWFFGKYLPTQHEAMERRFTELQKTYEQAIAAQMQVTERQRELFEESLTRIMEGFARLELAVQGLQQRIEHTERYRPPSSDSSSST